MGLMTEPPLFSPPAVMGSSQSQVELVLEIFEGNQKRVYRVLEDSLKVGRSSDCDIRISDTSASRLHCIFQRQGSDMMVLDNNTPNGTFINGQRLEGFKALKSGDKIIAGNTLIVFKRYVPKSSLQPRVQTDARARAAAGAPLGFIQKSDTAVNNLIQSPKGKIEPRFIIYGVVLLMMVYLGTQDDTKVTESGDITVEDVKKDPTAVYQKLMAGREQDGGLADDPRSKALRQSALKITESSATILLATEAALLRDEQQSKLDGLIDDRFFGAPKLEFKQKLSREHFFSGLREYHYSNYARAEEHFKAAIEFETDLKPAQDYLVSSTNKRRLAALEEYRIADRYFSNRRYDLASKKFQSTMDLIVKDLPKTGDNEWSQLYKNSRDFIALCAQAMGIHNEYTSGTR